MHRRQALALCRSGARSTCARGHRLGEGEWSWTAPRPASAGTLVFGAEQGGGPDWCLNLILDVDCNAFWNVVFQTPVIRGAFLFTPSFTYKPDLISQLHAARHNPHARDVLHPQERRSWSDGVPVTGKDWRFTWQTAMNAKYKDHIDSARLGGHPQRDRERQGRERSPSSGTSPLGAGCSATCLPQHALAGTDMLTVWNDCICNPKKGNAPIADGPFLLTDVRSRLGHHARRRTTRGWYGKPAKLDSIVFRFITNTNSEIQAIRAGEVDAIYPQPQLALADLETSVRSARSRRTSSLSWEHIEIQQGVEGQTRWRSRSGSARR